MKETSIADVHTSLYILAIKNLAFRLPYVQTLRTNHCGNTCCEAFNFCRENQYVLCRHDYSERVVVSFSHQINYEYYVGNISMFIEGIALGHFYAPT